MLNYWNRWILGWVTLADGLAEILTLGVWAPNWQIKFLSWQIQKDLRNGYL
jgi:hypothetical protein